MAKITQISIKTKTLGSFVSQASKPFSSPLPLSTLWVDTTKEDQDFLGVSLSLEGHNLRVRTPEGIFPVNGAFLSKSRVLKITTASGKTVTGTPTHKVFSDDWIPLNEVIPGITFLSCVDDQGQGYTDLVVSKEELEGEHVVADISVPGPRCYLLANGLKSHNSILCNQLNLNQSSMGYKTNLTPLEMTTPEMLSRSMASVTGFNSIDIFLKRLADGERDAIYRKMRRFDKKVASANGQYTIFKPKEDMSIEELLAAVHSLNGDITYIDYIGLLKGADGDDQWRKLGQIARYGKIYAEIHNKVVVLLAQVSDDGKLRYSQAIKEHSSLAWTFVATKETKEKGYMNIELLKSRNQNPQPFTLKCDYSKMHVSDLDPSELKEIEKAANSKDTDRRSKGKFKASESGDESDYVPDLTE